MHRRQNQDISLRQNKFLKHDFKSNISNLEKKKNPFSLIQIGECRLAKKLVLVLLSVCKSHLVPNFRTSRQTGLLDDAFNFLFYAFVNAHLGISLQKEANYEGFRFLCTRHISVE